MWPFTTKCPRVQKQLFRTKQLFILERKPDQRGKLSYEQYNRGIYKTYDYHFSAFVAGNTLGW